MVHLQVLWIGETNLTGSTEDLAKLKHLTELGFGNTKVTGGIKDLAELHHLTAAGLRGHQGDW